VVKIGRNSVFFDRKAHIPDRLYIMILHINFYGFLICLNFDTKFKVVSLPIYKENVSLWKTNDRNSIFLIRKSHIPDPIYIMVLYIIFMWYNFFSNFGSKSKGIIRFQFYQKR
jgi:hypothetical protein